MGDMGDLYRDWGAGKKAMRDKYGVDCPQCRAKQPKRTPTILLPGQRCKVDGYRDPRPRVSDEEFEAVTGWSVTRSTK
jgi:hypothetical protein